MSLPDPQETLVTVTGASGFIALYCIRELLTQGYRVRGTLRSLANEGKVRAAIAMPDADARLGFVEADLLSDVGWDAAVSGAKYVLHVASPVPKAPPKHEDDLIRPAREGVLRVLAASRAAGVSRVVMTSSVAAVSSGHPRSDHVFDERDWSDLSSSVDAYEKSKTLAERAAWDDVKQHGAPELVALNPVLVIGPSLSGAENTSNEIVRKLVHREIPGVARWQVGLVDVRDVALAHLTAMTLPNVAGERFILVSENVWMKDVADTLAAAGYKVPTRQVPNFVVYLIAIFDPIARLILGQLGKPLLMSGEKARNVLGFTPRSMKEMVLDTAASLRPPSA